MINMQFIPTYATIGCNPKFWFPILVITICLIGQFWPLVNVNICFFLSLFQCRILDAGPSRVGQTSLLTEQHISSHHQPLFRVIPAVRREFFECTWFQMSLTKIRCWIQLLNVEIEWISFQTTAITLLTALYPLDHLYGPNVIISLFSFHKHLSL